MQNITHYSFQQFFLKTTLAMTGWLKEKTRRNGENRWPKRHNGEWVLKQIMVLVPERKKEMWLIT